MIDHHIQRQILRLTGKFDGARFSDIRPAGLENNAFQYHLQRLISAKYISKNDGGLYVLTPSGKKAFISSHLDMVEEYQQAHAIFLCVLRDGDRWLVRKRRVQPELGRIGFVHGEPSSQDELQNTATKRFQAKTGLLTSFQPVGSGYIRIYDAEGLSSFTHATVLLAGSFSGELLSSDKTGENIWLSSEELHALESELIPSMPDLVVALDRGEKPFFFDRVYT